MKRSTRFQAVRWLVLVLALGLLVGQALPASAGPLDRSSGRIAVVVFPDLDGDGPGSPDCLGCDGDFLDGDSRANSDDPLPALEVVLLDADGAEVNRNETNGLANGRQVTFFTVQEIADYTVELVLPDEGWDACPDAGLEVKLTEADFDETTGIASVDYFVWHGCDADVMLAKAPAAVEEADEAVTEEEAGTEEEMAEEAVEPVDEGADEAASAEGAADEEEADVAGEGEEPAEGEAVGPAEAEAEEAAEPEDMGEAEEAAEPEAVEEAEEAAEPEETEEEVEETAPLGGIQGLVFMDLDQDGVASPDEPGVSLVPVHLEDGGQTLSQTTSGAGDYDFAELEPGLYDLYVEVPVGYELTTVDRYDDIMVDADIIAGLDFGIVATAGTTEEPEVTADDAESMPQTGVQLHSTSGLLVGLATVIGLVGFLGLAVESRIGRRTHARKDG
ncbi:MAG: SdrD B-like domain-containing protein [Anaerolineae bacterium]